MRLFTSIADLPPEFRRGALSIGNFDGVHRGHAQLVERLKEMALRVGGPTVVFTFDPHPVRLLRPDRAPPPLTWTDRKAELLSELGIHAMVAYPTNEELLRLSPREFFDQIVRGKLEALAMVEGPNFYFGCRREGTIETLRTFCHDARMQLEIVEPLTLDNELVSSSRIRQLIQTGQVGPARRMLTRAYRIRGVVTHGAARGAKIGFPTANLEGMDTILPCTGVYAGRADIGGHIWPAAIHLGPNPTFGEQSVKVEVHLIGFSGNLYAQLISIDFWERLRDIHPFPNVEALQQQLKRDVAASRRIHEENV